MFWLICGLLTLIVAVAIAAAMWRSGAGEVPAAYDLRVYRDQLREVERDLERGVIGAQDAERLRIEISRKILDTDKRLDDGHRTAKIGNVAAALIILAITLAAAVGLYAYQGAPGAPDLPLSARIAAANAAYDNRPTQEQAEAQAKSAMPAAPKPQADVAELRLIEQLREAVAKNPEDPRGLAFLATYEMRLGNVDAALTAQKRLVAVRKGDESADDLILLATLMVENAGGVITAEAEQYLARALQLEPDSAQGRYLLGMLQLQNGRPDRAFAVWRRLVEDGPVEAPWYGQVSAAMSDLAWLAGEPEYVPPEPPQLLARPDAEAVADAEDMSPEARQEMIAGMVARLESRLATQGGSPEEWARLISSLAVIGQPDKARAIWAEAQQIFGDTPDAIAPIRDAAEKAGIAE